VFQFGKDRVGRLPVHGSIVMPLDLGRGFLSELECVGLGLSPVTHAYRHELLASSYTHPTLKTTASEASSWSLRSLIDDPHGVGVDRRSFWSA
jgi:hypothetical protein